MALKHVNAVVVGSGAGGGIVAKELAEAGLSVVLLERGKWFTSADDRKDDLRNQRTSAMGASFGPDERNPRAYAAPSRESRVPNAGTGSETVRASSVSHPDAAQHGSV